MLSKRLSSLLYASVFCAVVPVSLTWAQSSDLRCSEQEALVDGLQNCDDAQARKKLEVDPAVTNSVNSGISPSSSSTDTTGDDNATASSADDGGTDSAAADDGDHDNGHGNDPDHDDPSNPGKGGGNHGTGNNGNGRN